MQIKEMMDAMRTEMQDTIQSQQTVIKVQQMRMENLESQLQAMGGLVAPVATHLDPLYTQQVLDATSTHRTAANSSNPMHSPHHLVTNQCHIQNNKPMRSSHRLVIVFHPKKFV